MSQQGRKIGKTQQRKQPGTTAAAVEGGGRLRRRSRLARHPLMTFIVLAFLISWLPVIPYTLGAFPAPVLASGPFLAAIAAAAIVGGSRGLRAYLRRLVRWRVGVVWYVVALLTR